MRGVVKRLVPEAKFGFLTAEEGVEYYFLEAGLKGPRFDELHEGSVVEFTVDEQSPLHNAENPTATDIRLVETAGPEAARGGELSQEPPAAVEGRKVDEASWQSFPASDPPAHSGTT